MKSVINDFRNLCVYQGWLGPESANCLSNYDAGNMKAILARPPHLESDPNHPQISVL